MEKINGYNESAATLSPIPEKARYDLLAGLFDYPDSRFEETVNQVQQYLARYYPEAASALIPFTDYIANAALDDARELFTRSFDVQAVTTLDLGYVIFGDDYKRAELLVNLNREHKAVSNDCHNELADHLPNLLRLIYKMKDRELAEELVQKIIAPAVYTMKGEFAADKMKKKNILYQKHYKTIISMSQEYGLVYYCTLEALYFVLQKDFGITITEKSKQTCDFLKTIGTELEIEKE